MTKVFSCEFWKISKNAPSYRTPPVATSGISRHGATKYSKIEIIVSACFFITFVSDGKFDNSMGIRKRTD